METWITNVIDTLGYAGLAFLVALENVFPPIPSEVVLPFAGFAAGRGSVSVVGMIIAATVGSVVGAWVLYGIAAWIGNERLERFVEKRGRWFGVKLDDLARAQAWFDRRQTSAVLIGRCVPLVRSVVSIPAGFQRMDPIRFTVYTAIGSLVWNTALIGTGYALGDQWERVEEYVSVLQWIVIAVIVIAIARFAWVRVAPRFRN